MIQRYYYFFEYQIFCVLFIAMGSCLYLILMVKKMLILLFDSISIKLFVIFASVMRQYLIILGIIILGVVTTALNGVSDYVDYHSAHSERLLEQIEEQNYTSLISVSSACQPTLTPTLRRIYSQSRCNKTHTLQEVTPRILSYIVISHLSARRYIATLSLVFRLRNIRI